MSPGGCAAVCVTTLVFACAGWRDRVADTPYTAGLARVEAVRVESRPFATGPFHVVVRGTLPDPCTHLDGFHVDRLGHRIDLTLRTRREWGDVCSPAAQPFERRLPIALEGLPAGLYRVTVNGVSTSFQLIADPGHLPRSHGGDF